MALLEVRGLTKYFGGLAAADNIDFDVYEGELLSIIGPNGAGKTTVFNLISGFLRPSRGKVIFQGKDITGKKPHDIAKKGIIRTWQATTIFKTKTVFDNTVLAHHLQCRSSLAAATFNTPSGRRDSQSISNKAMELLEVMGLAEMKNELAMNLSHGYQRKLEIAIGLAAKPKLLLLDEAVIGMNPEETMEMMNLIRKLQGELGLTIILVEHDMKAVMGFSDRIVVLNYGKKIAEGLPNEIRENKEVVEAYLGRDGG